MYKVYILLNENKNIIGVESTAFHKEQDLIDKGYIKIDEGDNGEIYGHAQPNYLREKYGKPLTDEYFRYNFKYEENQIVEISDEEKEAINTVTNTEPTQEERIQALESALLEMVLGGAE